MSLRASIRWHAKKAARSGVSRLSGALAFAGERRALRVLTYHSFGAAYRDPFYLELASFRLQMEHLAENHLAIALDDLGALLEGKGPDRSGTVLVTIDDGLLSLHREALPILRDLAIPAVAFVSPGLLEGCVSPMPPPEPTMEWKQLEEIVAAGVEIGSHGWSHRSLGQLPVAEAEDEARRSRALLEQRLGAPVRAFAYPFGAWPDFSPETRAALERCGYDFGFTSQHGAVHRGADPLELPRIKVEGGDSMTLFRSLPRGGMDPWRVIDRSLWRIQARP